jgi:hypothetical protein
MGFTLAVLVDDVVAVWPVSAALLGVPAVLALLLTVVHRPRPARLTR